MSDYEKEFIEFVEPHDLGFCIVVLTKSKAIEQARKSFRKARPELVDNRSDAEALEDFMIVHWAKESDHGRA